MICPFCETEYPTGTDLCAECQNPLVTSFVGETSDLVLEPLDDLSSRRQLELLVQLLEAASIPYSATSGTTHGMLERQTLVDRVHRREWHARVEVVSSRYEEARSAWRAAAERAASETADDEGDEAGEDDDSPSEWDYSSNRFEPR